MQENSNRFATQNIESLWLTESRGKASLIGVVLDGFPVYGILDDNGSAPTGLDSCNGHVVITFDYPQGFYRFTALAASMATSRTPSTSSSPTWRACGGARACRTRERSSQQSGRSGRRYGGETKVTPAATIRA